jgi:cytochrome P450
MTRPRIPWRGCSVTSPSNRSSWPRTAGRRSSTRCSGFTRPDGIGSRRCAAETEFDGIRIRRGALVLYSPYLTQRDPRLWTDPLSFRPERFLGARPSWGFIPFAAGERTCLGRPFARLVLSCVLDAMAGPALRFTAGNLRPRAGLTLAPSGPVVLHR